MKRLTHDETLRWIAEHHAWRRAHKTKAIWARPVAPEEVGKEFQTADHGMVRAHAGYWLCAGSAGEPWFQSKDKIDSKYEYVDDEERRYTFDDVPRRYQLFTPRSDVSNWAAQVKDPEVDGFFIQPNYPTDGPLYSPAGGYVVKDDADDPYSGNPNDVWLVQQALFESTYELTQ